MRRLNKPFFFSMTQLRHSKMFIIYTSWKRTISDRRILTITLWKTFRRFLRAQEILYLFVLILPQSKIELGYMPQKKYIHTTVFARLWRSCTIWLPFLRENSLHGINSVLEASTAATYFYAYWGNEGLFFLNSCPLGYGFS